MKSRYLSLIELMVGIAIIAIAAGAVGFRIVCALEDARFQSSLDRVSAELSYCQRQARSMQADWFAVIQIHSGRLAFQRSCPEAGQASMSTWESHAELRWDEKPIERISIHFAATGKIAPSGALEWIGKRRKVRWDFPDRFSVFEVGSEKLARPDLRLSK